MEHGEKITDPVFMETLLRRIQNQKSQLKISIPRKAGTYNTALLDIRPQAGVLIFDQLAPNEGHPLLLKTRIMHIEASFNGVRITMQCHLQQTLRTGSYCQYQMQFPPHLWYYQQRKNFRVQISNDIDFSMQINSKSYGWLDAQVTDVSPDGCGIKFNRDINFEKGELIKHCKLILPDKHELPCKLIVRYVSHDDHRKLTHAGIKLLDFDVHDKKEYLRAIQNTQREMIRRQARTPKAG